jgi:hypothetical protein
MLLLRIQTAVQHRHRLRRALPSPTLIWTIVQVQVANFTLLQSHQSIAMHRAQTHCCLR